VVQLFHADGRTNERTDKTKLTVVSRNFVNESKNCSIFLKFYFLTNNNNNNNRQILHRNVEELKKV